MKTSLTLVLGIVLGIVIGFVIFTTTPIGQKYKYVTVGEFSLVRYDTWSGKASILSGESPVSLFGVNRLVKNFWVPLPSSSRD
jgi:hypothetical protein